MATGRWEGSTWPRLRVGIPRSQRLEERDDPERVLPADGVRGVATA
ncbi:hypothetical protein ACFXA4_28710 [Streptomyces sp. NPDC059442]